MQAFELTRRVDPVPLRGSGEGSGLGSGPGYDAAEPSHEPFARFLHKVIKQNPIRLWSGLRCHCGLLGCHLEYCSYYFGGFEVIFLWTTFRPGGLFMAGTDFITVAP